MSVTRAGLVLRLYGSNLIWIIPAKGSCLPTPIVVDKLNSRQVFEKTLHNRSTCLLLRLPLRTPSLSATSLYPCRRTSR